MKNEYVVTKRLKTKVLCGEVNLPYGTILQYNNHLITYQGKPICYRTSQNAYDFLSNNDDDKGLERGKLVHAIMDLLRKKDSKHQDRWDKIWDDEEKLGKYRRKEHPDQWLWNFEFYNAPIEELEYILNKIKEVK